MNAESTATAPSVPTNAAAKPTTKSAPRRPKSAAAYADAPYQGKKRKLERVPRWHKEVLYYLETEADKSCPLQGFFSDTLTARAAEIYLKIKVSGARFEEEIIFLVDCEHRLAAMSWEHRTMLLLCAYGYTQAQIAAVIGCSLRTITRKMHDTGLKPLHSSPSAGRAPKAVTLRHALYSPRPRPVPLSCPRCRIPLDTAALGLCFGTPLAPGVQTVCLYCETPGIFTPTLTLAARVLP